MSLKGKDHVKASTMNSRFIKLQRNIEVNFESRYFTTKLAKQSQRDLKLTSKSSLPTLNINNYD